MTWVTWAQHRREALVTTLILGITGALLLITGLSMLADFDRSGIARCVGAGASAVGVFAGGSSCDAVGNFPLRWHRLDVVAPLALMSLPALLGVFIAAPLLSREFEQGTHLLAWSQSITRLRWAASKLGLVAGYVLLVASALAILVVWWHKPLDLAGFNGPWDAFDIEGLVPIAYAAFALAVGTLAGLVIRRTVPAMALTLFLFVGFRLLVFFIRPHFLLPVTGSAMNVGQGAWLVGPSHYADTHGHLLSLDQVNGVMQGYAGSSAAGLTDYLHQHGINLLADYQPLGRFWTFQAIEAAIFFGLTAFLIAAALWWLQRRA